VAGDFASVISHYLNGELEESRRTLWRLLYYRKHLQEVARGRPSILERFMSKFRSTAHDPPNFYGTMFEVEIAASFLRKGVSFEKRESPDFRVNVGDEVVGVERTTGRLEGSGLPLKKLEGRVKKKGAKNYVGLSDAVFVDATGALYASAGGGTPRMEMSMEDNMKRFMTAGVHEADVGAALALFRVVHDAGGIETIFSRVDYLKVNERLRQFLNTAYPYGERKVDLGRIWYLSQN
jgi:hypothetical protein